jgi:hypothetical protein
MFGSGWAVLVAALGAVLLVAALLLARRWGVRRSVGVAGAGLLLLGLALSGFVGILVQLLAVGLNPVRWLGLVTAGVGVVMLFSAGMLPRPPRSRAGAAQVQPAGGAAASARKPVGRGTEKGTASSQRQSVDDDMAEIEEILKRRGIQ